MYFVQRPTTLFQPFFLASPSTEYVIPVFGPEEEKNAPGKVSKQTATKQTNLVRYGSNVNVTEEDDKWIIYMDMPGVKPSDVTVEEKMGDLKVEAERKNGVRYEQQFSLDPKKADLSKLGAELADGVLTLTIPKKTPLPPISIPISSEEAPEMEDKQFYFTLDLPGVALSGLKLEWKDDKLFIYAERKRMGKTAKIERAVQIQPSVDMSQGKAYLADGVLTVVAPRLTGKEETETHKIKVGGAKPVIETIEEEN